LITFVFLGIGRHLAHRITLRERHMEEANQNLSIALESMANGLIRWSNENTLLIANSRAQEMLTLPPDVLKPGFPLRDLIMIHHAKGAYGSRSVDDVYRASLKVINRRLPYCGLEHLANGQVIRHLFQPVSDGGWLATFEDVTEREAAAAKIAFLAHHDPLTELPNRV
jgi:PAS domain-containing protein